MRVVVDSVVIETLIIFHHLSKPSAPKMTLTENYIGDFKEEMGNIHMCSSDGSGQSQRWEKHLSIPSIIIYWDAYFDSNNYYHL